MAVPPEICPNCGAYLPKKAKACPECGSDEKTGWSDQARYDGLDLPDDSFDYGDFVKREFGGNEVRPRGISWWWWLVALVLAVIFLAFFLR